MDCVLIIFHEFLIELLFYQVLMAKKWVVSKQKQVWLDSMIATYQLVISIPVYCNTAYLFL